MRLDGLMCLASGARFVVYSVTIIYHFTKVSLIVGFLTGDSVLNVFDPLMYLN